MRTVAIKKPGWTTLSIPVGCLVPLVGFEVFGSVVAYQPGEPGQHRSENEFDYSKHGYFL
jgi:hypothetical protein